MRTKFSVVIPIYKNEQSIDALFDSLEKLAADLNERLQIVFVNDSSPDSSALKIAKRKTISPLEIKLIHHTRNFGSFSAIRSGLKHATGDYVGVISGDLQEPPSLLFSFFETLRSGDIEIVFGSRISRSDPFISRILSKVYWFFYRKYINEEIPQNGVDVFACKRVVVDVITSLNETNTSLIGMLFWVGFKRDFQEYVRLPREHGKSAWTFKKKLQYMANSIFSFSNLPLRIIRVFGVFGSLASLSLGFILLLASLTGRIEVPGYAPIMLAILFGNSSILIGLGILGSYLWRTYENTQMRPYGIIRSVLEEDDEL